jgi:YjbR
MTGATESAHMNHPDFRSNGRIFATLAPDGKRGMIKLTPEQQAQFISAHPGVFEPAAGAWGRGGSTMVLLATADPEAIGEAMTLAWKRTAEVTSRRPTVAGRNITRGAGKSRRS